MEGKQLRGLIRYINRMRLGQQVIYLEYPYDFKRRWGSTGHSGLLEMISAQEETYRQNLAEIATFDKLLSRFNNPNGPILDFDNSFMPVLDGLSVMWAAKRAKRLYLEIGSGFSTIYARAALDDGGSTAKILSIDPHPRAEIDKLCDESIRTPLEQIDMKLFDRLEAGDSLFFDGSHRSFTNSDVTVFFLEVLPRLKPGVLVGIHDVFLPFDYPESWHQRAYNEHYILAAFLLANPRYFSLQMCNHWIGVKGLHTKPVEQIWNVVGAKARKRAGSAWWAIKN